MTELHRGMMLGGGIAITGMAVFECVRMTQQIQRRKEFLKKSISYSPMTREKYEAIIAQMGNRDSCAMEHNYISILGEAKTKNIGEVLKSDLIEWMHEGKHPHGNGSFLIIPESVNDEW